MAANWLRPIHDVTFGEDLGQVPPGSAPAATARLRGPAVAVLRLTGITNTAAGIHQHVRRPERRPEVIMNLAC
ncbi:hypothetical protein [Pseudofrankia inefficax]|uniref:hypothetical protein n=1 Tax=Pseudofrankia inefficax (strain DSM 45817 / CECT 9037 / DDB 130130 / EuI1c) TaxID=298654 RepID=UPI0002E32CD5|nr:hypothetical protein [Pseudofrankia inefficax]